MATAIRVDHLVKRYGSVTAVNDISFEVATGSLFAFLGANGAGKSTTINCLNTRLRADGGELEVSGHRAGKDDDAIRRTIGVVFQNALLDPLLTVRENLLVRGQFYGITKGGKARVNELASLVNLTSFLDRRYGKLSGGQKRRADIARALIHAPSLLFLDEPTAGLDPASRETVWTAIANLRQESGLTVFLTTHYMEETERADNVCVIDTGKIVAQGTPTELRAKYAHDELSLTLQRPDQI
ncbi:MAG: ABC transporter ATP-binding protein [Thermomicrobiales bacterium]